MAVTNGCSCIVQNRKKSWQIKELNMNIGTEKCLAENIGVYLYSTRIQETFFNQTQNPQTIQEKIFEFYLLKLKSSV